MLRQILLIVTVLSLNGCASLMQGKVVDENGLPVKGAVVTVMGINHHFLGTSPFGEHTISDKHGKFALKIPRDVSVISAEANSGSKAGKLSDPGISGENMIIIR